MTQISIADTENTARPAGEGAWERPRSRFRAHVTADGSSGFPAADGRYRLYVSLACPWAHRTIIVRRLKGLEAAIAYDHAVSQLFETLDRLESRLGSTRFLHGDRITEADWRLFTTLVRFDPVYHTHFKCNLRLIADYPNLLGFACDLCQVPGVAGTVDLDQIKRHYSMTHARLNPRRIVAASNGPDLSVPHGRG